MLTHELNKVVKLPGSNYPSTAERNSESAARQFMASSGKALPPQRESAPSREQIVKAMAAMEDYFQSMSRDLRFEIDEKSGVNVISILDGETGELIRRFPAEEIVASARFIAENAQPTHTGLLLDRNS